jgi:hypothetical protein
MPYSWMISFADLTDELILKRGDTYLTTHPISTKNYYDLTAEKFISFVNSFNIDVSVLNALDRTVGAKNPPHYLVIQWLINCLQMLVCQNNMGFNNVQDGIQQDVYYIKFKHYSSELVAVQSQIRYETIVTGVMQQNYTRAGNTVRIMNT